MLCDWLTLCVSLDVVPPEVLFLLDHRRIFCIDTQTGESCWETAAWESVRSDSHQVATRLGVHDILIQGSPARLLSPSGDNVFGSLDLVVCVSAMVGHVWQAAGVPFPGISVSEESTAAQCAFADSIRIRRMDVTGNLCLGSLAEVRTALAWLRGTEGGRYRVSQQAGDTVYWSHRSRLRSGKAYAKGPELRRRKDGEIPESDLLLADRLLRLELKLGSQWWREDAPSGGWYNIPASFFSDLWSGYFGRMVSGLTGLEVVVEPERFIDQLLAQGVTKRQASAVLRTWAFIRADGWQAARESMPRRTWYHHVGLLRSLGLTDLDLSHGQVVPFSVRRVSAELVSSWDDLRRVA